jgi:predicted amidophosphoribosyltransferase
MVTIRSALEELLLPGRCPGCDGGSRARLCPRCTARLDACALPDLGAVRLAAGITAVGAFAYDDVAADIVRTWKVAGHWATAPALGALLRARIGLPPAGTLPVTWVPSSRRKRRVRGVELPQLLAGPGAVRLLTGTRERPDQTELDAAARLRNASGAFAALGRAPPAVVCVDDVRTTGATATAAALALRAAGARRVLVVTFAVAGGDPGLGPPVGAGVGRPQRSAPSARSETSRPGSRSAAPGSSPDGSSPVGTR